MADLFLHIPEFSGRKGERDAGRWLRNVETILKGERDVLDLKKFVTTFDMKLTGEASEWADRTPEVYNAVEAVAPTQNQVKLLTEVFLERFGTTRPEPMKATEELRVLHQEPDEKIASYYRRANRILCRMIPGKDFELEPVIAALTEPEKILMHQVVDKFCDGFYHKWMHFPVWREQPKSLHEATRIAEKQEQYQAFLHTRYDTSQGTPIAYDPLLSTPMLYPPQSPTNYGFNPEVHVVNQGVTPISPPQIILPPSPPPVVHSPPAPQHSPPAPQAGQPNAGSNGGNGHRVSPFSSSRGGYGPQPRGSYYNNAGSWRDHQRKPEQEKNSGNPYVSGSLKWYAASDGPLCVDCGTLGHIATNCSGVKLATWERDALRNIVFNRKDYLLSQTSRLFNAGLPINETECREETRQLYLSAGFKPDEKHPQGPTKSEEGIQSITARSATLVLGDTTTPGYVTEVASRASHFNTGSQFEVGSGKGMAIINAYAGSNVDNGQGPRAPDIPMALMPNFPKPSIPRKRVAIEDIIDQEEGGRAVHHQILEEEVNNPGNVLGPVNELGNVFAKRGKRKSKAIRRIQGMIGKDRRTSLAKYLWDLTITLPFPEYLQDCASARSELKKFTSLESTGIRRKRKKKIVELDTPMVDVQGGKFRSFKAKISGTPENWGSFVVRGDLGDLEKANFTRGIRVCIDAGSEAELITPFMVEKLKLDTIPMARTPWPKLTLKTSVGTLQPLLGLASGYVTVEGVEVPFYACIIDPKYAEETDYDILLGVPWLATVKAVQSVHKAQIQITCPETKRVALVQGPEFRPIDFKRLFLEIGGKLGNLHERAELSKEVWGYSDESDSEEESEDYSDSDDSTDDDRSETAEGQTNPPNSPYQHPLPLKCRGAILEIDKPNQEKEEVRYIEARDYLQLYGTAAPYSFLAEKMIKLPRELQKGPKGEAILIMDHDGKSRARDGRKRNFRRSAMTQN